MVGTGGKLEAFKFSSSLIFLNLGIWTQSADHSEMLIFPKPGEGVE